MDSHRVYRFDNHLWRVNSCVVHLANSHSNIRARVHFDSNRPEYPDLSASSGISHTSSTRSHPLSLSTSLLARLGTSLACAKTTPTIALAARLVATSATNPGEPADPQSLGLVVEWALYSAEPTVGPRAAPSPRAMENPGVLAYGDVRTDGRHTTEKHSLLLFIRTSDGVSTLRPHGSEAACGEAEKNSKGRKDG
jgi:hypothetical protein